MTKERNGWVKLFEIDPSTMREGAWEVHASETDPARRYAVRRDGTKITIHPELCEEAKKDEIGSGMDGPGSVDDTLKKEVHKK